MTWVILLALLAPFLGITLVGALLVLAHDALTVSPAVVFDCPPITGGGVG
jgi:hypothetical protein